MKNESLIKGIIVAVLIIVTFWFGVKPLITGTSYGDYTKLSGDEYDFGEYEYATIVIGSEPEGLASALACSRTGLKTLLITEDSNLGSYIKSSMISYMEPQYGMIAKKKVLLNQGIYNEIFGKFTVGFSGEDYEETVKKLVEREKNLYVIYDSFLVEADVEGERLKGILVQQPGGKQYYKARNFIDATRDGQLLTLCRTPYFKGSEDIGIKDFYASAEFNFLISGVDVEALKKSRKKSNFFDEFQMALLAYDTVNKRTKLVSPSFIIQGDNELVISGLQIYGVNVEDDEDISAAFKEAEDEARMLTAFLKNTIIAFKNCTYKKGPESLFFPEYRHFEGRTRLTVTDIFENRDFPNKVALCSQSVNADKFVMENTKYIVTKPNVYAIPLGSIIPVNLENVMMTGSKAGFSSLASSSAGSIPARITVGESAGLVSAYSFISDITPAGLLDLSGNDLKSLKKYITRGGVTLPDFSENLKIPETEEKLADHWSYPYLKTLVEYGLIAGGEKNDFKLDYKGSQELLAVLIKNAALKMAPDSYTLALEEALKPFEVKDLLTGETAAAIVLAALSEPYPDDKALETLKSEKLLPQSLTDRLAPRDNVTLDVVYGLAVETVKAGSK